MPTAGKETWYSKFLHAFGKPTNLSTSAPQLERGLELESPNTISRSRTTTHKHFTFKNQLYATIFKSWINVLLLAAPVSITIHYAGVNKIIVFVVNFIAIIPLAAMLSFATEEIPLYVGETLGGLLNASFGNAVELIVAVIALAKGEVFIVQTSLIGSILSNSLLVLGMYFFFGGLGRKEQIFNRTFASTAANMLVLFMGGILTLTAFDYWNTTTPSPIAAISRGAALILLTIYAAYLYFQLRTHKAMFDEESPKGATTPHTNAVPHGALAKALAKTDGMAAAPGRASGENRQGSDKLLNQHAYEEADDPKSEEPQLHLLVAWATLAVATAFIGLCAEFMVDSIGALTKTGHISEEFVGLILLPIVGNAAEHATAAAAACKDKMDLAVGVAIGSSLQVALLLLPLMVVIGWIMGNDAMYLSFDGFQVAILFVAILLVNYITADRKSNWMEDSDNIRLLRLLPNEDEAAPIHCELWNYSLQRLSLRTHLYEALSYVWGDPDKTLSIYVDKNQFQVTVNLHTALSYLRDYSFERIIWVYAICIDQSNPEERKEQVQLIAKIYSNAHRVIV
ncbi:hypothetical protein ACMFMG_011713 [Clarireedia jacksonii]